MIVILLGQIDLSVPWVVAVGGMMATAATGWGPLGQALAIPVRRGLRRGASAWSTASASPTCACPR